MKIFENPKHYPHQKVMSSGAFICSPVCLYDLYIGRGRTKKESFTFFLKIRVIFWIQKQNPEFSTIHSLTRESLHSINAFKLIYNAYWTRDIFREKDRSFQTSEYM